MRPARDLRGGRSSQARALPPPTGGWNARDSIDNMPVRDAITLENWFPQQRGVVTRPGFKQHCSTGTTKPVGMLAEYEFGTRNRLLAASNGSIFDVTAATPTTLKAGLSATAIQFVTTSLGGSMFFANGTDNLQRYDGLAIADATYTGLALNEINYAHTHKSRMYVVRKNTQEFWYGGTEAITGALAKFDLSLTGTFAGNLFAITSISRDGGSGPDDFIVFLFEGGDCVVYQGSNPGDATNWARVGMFKVGRPLSRQAIFQADADVYIVTDRGYEPLSRVMPFGKAAVRNDLLSNKIQIAVNDAIQLKGATDEWQVQLYPKGQMLIINVPFSSTRTEQHVMNINTGAWAKFIIPAMQWSRLKSDMYFGDLAGNVHLFDGGDFTDNGAPIRCDCQQAWTYFQDRGHVKKLNLIRPIFVASILPSVRLSVGADFEVVQPGVASSVGGAASQFAIWDNAASVWDVSIWSPERTAHQRWYKDNALGYAFSTRLVMDVTIDEVAWNSTTYLFERGGLI